MILKKLWNMLFPTSTTKPTTVEDVVDHFIDQLTNPERKYIWTHDDPNALHHSIGRALRNEYGLWDEDSLVKKDAAENYGIAHADDISRLIMAWVWAKVRCLPFDPVEHCEPYWAQYGLTSLEAGNHAC